MQLFPRLSFPIAVLAFSRLPFLTSAFALQFVSPSVVARRYNYLCSRSLATATVPLVVRAVENSDGSSTESECILTYVVTGTGRGNKVTMTNNNGHEMVTDIPKKYGGNESAPTPVETLLAALIGCIQSTGMYVARSMAPRILVDRIEFDLKAQRDGRAPLEMPLEKTPELTVRPTRVFGTATVYQRNGEPIAPEQLQLLGTQTEARCPVSNLMQDSGCAMDIDWIDGSAT